MKILKKYLWISIYLLAGFFLAGYFYRNWPLLHQVINPASLHFFFYALICNTLAFGLYGYIWVYIITRHNTVQKFSVYKCFYVSQITRYVPGNIWSVLARFENNKQFGISYGASAYYYAIENIMLLSSALFFSLFSFSLLGNKATFPIIIGFCIFFLGGGLLFFKPEYFQRLIGLIEKRFGKVSTFSDLGKYELLMVFLLFCLYWILFGLALYFIVLGIIGGSTEILHFFGINAAAWLIGYFSFITPSGLGVREGAFVLLFHTLIPATTALSIALVSRFIFTFSELICLGIVVTWTKLKKLRKNIESV